MDDSPERGIVRTGSLKLPPGSCLTRHQVTNIASDDEARHGVGGPALAAGFLLERFIPWLSA